MSGIGIGLPFKSVTVSGAYGLKAAAHHRPDQRLIPTIHTERRLTDFGRLKDFRRIGTRYDRRADVFLAAVCLAATVSYWL